MHPLWASLRTRTPLPSPENAKLDVCGLDVCVDGRPQFVRSFAGFG